MNKRKIIQTLQRCVDEIKMLRRANNELAPNAEAFDALQQVLDLLPRRERGVVEDMVWKLEQDIKTLEAEKAVEDIDEGAPV